MPLTVEPKDRPRSASVSAAAKSIRRLRDPGEAFVIVV